MSNSGSEEKFIWPDIGQERAVAFLDKSLNSGRLAQTYIFSGPADLGKSTLALAFARNLLAQDPSFVGDLDRAGETVNSDLHILHREEAKQQISVNQAREFMKMLGFSSFFNSYKIGIIKEAEKLSPEAQSSLLKTLEEPKEKVIIILLTTDLGDLPATIISRAQIIRFYPTSSEFIYNYLINQHQIKRSEAKELAPLVSGRPLRAKKLLANPEIHQEQSRQAKAILSLMNLSLANRRHLLEDLFKGNDVSQSDFQRAEEILILWRSLWRDLILAALDQGDLIRHQNLQDDFRFLIESRKDSSGFLIYLLSINQRLKSALDYLSANVSPKNTLLSIAFSL